MFGPAITSAAREAMRRLATRRVPADPVILPAPETRPAPMRPLRPPAAGNDNPLAALEAEVEQELRARGYLG